MKRLFADARPRPRSYFLATLLVALLLCTAACGGTSRTNADTATSVPTTTASPTATPPPPLPFRAVTLPAGYTVQVFTLAVSPLDGTIAWACAPVGDGSFHVWLTTNEAATWRAVGTLHPTTPEQAACAISADQGDLHAAVFTAEWGGGEAGDLGSLSLYTADDGAHWTQLPGWTAVTAVDTFGATVYAMLTITTPIARQKQSASWSDDAPSKLCAPCSTPTTQQQFEFVVSRDGLRTWSVPQSGGAALDTSLWRFWNDPASGTVYAASEDPSLWQSADAGATWTKLAVPAVDVTLAALSATTHTWTFCGTSVPPAGMECSTDTGTDWHAVSTLQATVTCADCPAKGGVAVQTSACIPDGIESDDALIAVCALQSDAFTSAHYTAYRQAVGASTWSTLGGVPSSGCSIAPNRIIWCTNQQGDTWMTAPLPA